MTRERSVRKPTGVGSIIKFSSRRWHTAHELGRRPERRSQVRILLVEDEPKMARAIRRGLEREGWAVDTAADGEDALLLGREREYDALILDVMLPSRDGVSVCAT